jgi:aspartyl-tRNA(Asn)/glutamyl-tRNA(Gln) amidotransferase subunit A
MSWRKRRSANDVNELLTKSALELLALIRSREISPVELVKASLDRIEATQPIINAFVTVTPELALEAARECERELAQGKTPRALHGLPISVKDLIALEGFPLTFGSRTLKSNIARFDAPSVERIKAAGACIVGKTTTTEFGCKVAGNSPLTGITRNPGTSAKRPAARAAAPPRALRLT